MAFTAKRFLLIMEINQTLFYLNDPNRKAIDHITDRIPVTYHDNYKKLQVSYRKARPQFLSSLFINMRDDVDVAVWSNLDSTATSELCHKYFTRYYRDLLFIMATNRGLYGDSSSDSNIRIRRDLSGVYNKFSGYNQTNTMVVSSTQNLLQTHRRNDLIIPGYTPSNPDFPQDAGLIPLAKYIQGLVIVQKQSGLIDLRRFVNAKQAKNIFKRAAHNMFNDTDYL